VHQDEGFSALTNLPLRGKVVSLKRGCGCFDSNHSGDVALLDADQEGCMTRKLCLNASDIDRRQLLVLAAATTASGVMPGVEPAGAAEPAEPVNLMGSLPSAESQHQKLCAVTVRRLQEIAERNRIRAEAKLPLLSVPREVRRMKEVDDAEEFNRFAARHREAVWDEVLKPLRDANGDPNWRPHSFIEGVGLQAQVLKNLRDRFAMRAGPQLPHGLKSTELQCPK
jgi:hypothetical protein